MPQPSCTHTRNSYFFIKEKDLFYFHFPSVYPGIKFIQIKSGFRFKLIISQTSIFAIFIMLSNSQTFRALKAMQFFQIEKSLRTSSSIYHHVRRLPFDSPIPSSKKASENRSNDYNYHFILYVMFVVWDYQRLHFKNSTLAHRILESNIRRILASSILGTTGYVLCHKLLLHARVHFDQIILFSHYPETYVRLRIISCDEFKNGFRSSLTAITTPLTCEIRPLRCVGKNRFYALMEIRWLRSATELCTGEI